MNCKNCNEPLESNWLECPVCETAVAQSNTCTTCGKELKPNWVKCPSCRTPTGKPSVASPSLGKSSSQNQMHSGYSQGFNQTVAGQGPDVPQIVLVSGDVVGNYTIKGKLGQGGFACVYRATENLLEEEHALKVLPLISRDYVKNILLEFKSRDRIKDFDHIIKAWQPQPAVYQGQDILLYPMELADMTFRQWLNEHKNQPDVVMSKGMDIFKQACKGVEAIHNAGLTHLDIKPENILLIKDLAEEEGWIAKVADFGLARGMGMENLAALEDGIGTPAYMAPEQIMAARWKDVGKEADIYALGMILYEMIDGDLPYSGTAKQIKEKKRDASIKVASLKPNTAIAEVTMDCIKRDAEARPSSVDYLIDVLNGHKNQQLSLSEDDIYAISDSTKEALESENETRIELLSKTGFLETKERVNIEMIFVNGGAFTMGLSDSPSIAAHEVVVSDYFISKYPIIQSQWQAIMNHNPSEFKGELFPVTNVNWQEIITFLEKLNNLSGKKYRLPTEAEWEYAARGGKNSSGYFFSGSNVFEEVGWFVDESNFTTHPIGLKKANELSLHDMSGNVYEWCSDFYEEQYYKISPLNDPRGPKTGETRVLRGGSSFSFPGYGTVFNRHFQPQSFARNDIGFRLAHPA